jgi:hypothetical protein
MAQSARPPIAHGINITSATKTGGRSMRRDLWLCWAGLDRAAGQRERDTHDLRILDIEQFSVLARVIAQPPQAAANHLLAQ